MGLSGYKQRCGECADSFSRAASYCPYCGTPTGVEFELGIGAVLYEDRPDTPDDERRLHHITDRHVSLESGNVFYVIKDGTHTQRYHYHAEDVLADFAPAGWQWPTLRKPTYWLTRHCGVDDEMDLMTDGGCLGNETDRYETPLDPFDRLVLNPRADTPASENPLCPDCEEPIRPFANQHERVFKCGCNELKKFRFDRSGGDR